MRFYSIVGSINYEIVPTRYVYHGPDRVNREKVPGISARFHDHMYDTKAQRELNHWDDATRILVEDSLMNHENFNTQWLQVVPDMEVEKTADDIAEAGMCISRTVTDEGVVDCDQQAIEGQFYCKRHLPVPSEVSA